jgi:hypothetical protein
MTIVKGHPNLVNMHSYKFFVMIATVEVRFINDAIKYLTYHFLMKHMSSTIYYL